LFVFVYFFPFFSQEEQEAAPSNQTLTESDKTESEPLTVIEQPEITASQPTTNQAMKGIIMLQPRTQRRRVFF